MAEVTRVVVGMACGQKEWLFPHSRAWTGAWRRRRT